MVRNCAKCGVEFYTRWSQSKYCVACKNFALKQGHKKPREKVKRTRVAKPVTVICTVCGSDFTALSKKALYCPKCKKEAERMNDYMRRQRNKEAKCLNSVDEYKQSYAIPKCPFWMESVPPKTIGCEGGRRLKFETSQERLLHLHQYCAKNPGYMECPYAGELLRKYEKGEQA